MEGPRLQIADSLVAISGTAPHPSEYYPAITTAQLCQPGYSKVAASPNLTVANDF